MTHAVMRNVNFGDNYSCVCVTRLWLPLQGSQSEVSILLKATGSKLAHNRAAREDGVGAPWPQSLPGCLHTGSRQIHGQTRYIMVPLPRLHPFTPRSQVLLPNRSCGSVTRSQLLWDFFSNFLLQIHLNFRPCFQADL